MGLLVSVLVLCAQCHLADSYVPNRTVVTLDVLGDGRSQLDVDLEGEEELDDHQEQQHQLPQHQLPQHQLPQHQLQDDNTIARRKGLMGLNYTHLFLLKE